MFKYMMVTLSVLLSSCGEREPVASGTRYPLPIQEPTAMQSCQGRVDFEWKDNNCVPRPNTMLTGELAISSGIIWQPSSQNCIANSIVNGEGISLFDRCEGFDLLIPIAKPSTGSGKALIRISYSGCSNTVKMPVNIDSGTFATSINANDGKEDALKLELDVTADSSRFLHISMIPDYQRDFAVSASGFLATCKVELLENSLQ